MGIGGGGRVGLQEREFLLGTGEGGGYVSGLLLGNNEPFPGEKVMRGMLLGLALVMGAGVSPIKAEVLVLGALADTGNNSIANSSTFKIDFTNNSALPYLNSIFLKASNASNYGNFTFSIVEGGSTIRATDTIGLDFSTGGTGKTFNFTNIAAYATNSGVNYSLWMSNTSGSSKDFVAGTAAGFAATNWTIALDNSQLGVTTKSIEFAVNAVPEPGTLLLGGIAAACGGGGVWWRRKRKAAPVVDEAVAAE